MKIQIDISRLRKLFLNEVKDGMQVKEFNIVLGRNYRIERDNLKKIRSHLSKNGEIKVKKGRIFLK